MAISDADLSNCIRHLGYDVQGLWQAGVNGGSLAYNNAGYRYFRFFGALLRRVQQLRPDEESRLTGRAYGSVGFTGFNPTPGDVVNVTVVLNTTGAIPITATVTCPAGGPNGSPFTLLNLCGQLSQNLLLQPAFQAAGLNAIATYGSGPYSDVQVPLPLLAIWQNVGQSGFTITTSYTGQTVPQVVNQGQLLSPLLAFKQAGGLVNVWGYLPVMDYLESAWLGETALLSVAGDNGVLLRSGEALQDRMEMRRTYRQELAAFLGVPANRDNPGIQGSCVNVSY